MHEIFGLKHVLSTFQETVWSHLKNLPRSFIYFLFLSDEGPMLEMLNYTIRIGSTPTFLYFDLYIKTLCSDPTSNSRYLNMRLTSLFFSNIVLHSIQSRDAILKYVYPAH